MKNGDLFSSDNASSSSEVWFNGVEVFGPSDFKKHGGLLKKNVSVSTDNQLKVVMRGKPGSQINLWVEDEAPDIVVTQPWADDMVNAPVTVKGYVTDHTITSVTFNHNGNMSTVPVISGSFSSVVNLTGVNNITVSSIDRTGTPRSTSLFLDGDYLPMQAELLYGFDPLNPDSDSRLTAENESGNGVPDGFETFNRAGGEKLLAFVKYRIGGDPFKVDSNGNGLSDYFELVKLGVMNVSSNTSMAMSLPKEDADRDGLTNTLEQAFGTDPLKYDTDGDGFSDGYEINTSHTNPLAKDSDNDGLDDGSEVKVGTDPNNPDTNGNGVPDGLETYTTTAFNDAGGVGVSVTGKGDVSKQVRITRETSEYYTGNPALASPLVNVTVNGSFDHAIVTMRYDPAIVTDQANYSLCYYNESLGLFLPVRSSLDMVNHTFSVSTTHLSTWGIFNLTILAGLYTQMANFNGEVAVFVTGSANIAQNTVNDPQNPVMAAKTYTVDQATNMVIISSQVTFNMGGGMAQGVTAQAALASSSSGSGSLDYSPIVITMNNKGETNWFGNGASFPPGVYQINATGWYTHWSPVPSELACIDMGPDRVVRMYAWSSRGSNYPYAGVSDKDRLGMHVKYGSNDSPVYALRIMPGTLQFTSNGGPIGMWDNDDAYNDNTYQLRYVLSYVGQSAPSLNLTDSDRDGLSDMVEMHGFMDARGRVYYTDPNKADTDGDGLTDGQEAGAMVMLNGMTYFHVKSSPMLKDSDGDGLADDMEMQIGSLPFVMDTDHDGLIDSIDNDPLVPLGQQVAETELEIARDLVLGAVFGLAGVEGGACYCIVGEASASVFYVVGWFVFSLVPVADTLTNIRDAAQCIANGDGVGAALYGSGILLSLVDAGAIATATGAVAIFIKLNPEKAAPLLRVLADVLKYLPDGVIEPTVRLFDKTGSVDKIVAGIRISGGSWGDVLGLVTKGGSLEDISTIVSMARLADAMMLADKGASIAEIAQFVEKGEDLAIVGQILEKSVKSADLFSMINKGANAGEVLGLLDKGAVIEDIAKILDLGGDLSKTTGWLNKGVTIDDIRRIFLTPKDNGNYAGTISKTIDVVKSGSGAVTVMWMEEGGLKSAAGSPEWVPDVGGTGWAHIENNHIIKPSGNDFEKFGPEYAASDPNYLKNIQNLIMTAAKNGDELVDANGRISRVYSVATESGPEVLNVGVSDKGYILTAYPDGSLTT
ncbi:hypothetical protein [Methanocella conradii]|uniref:hypothetical protein n=1 Tax=Methanocella conradii TaxID=1175444 RepID=UPI00157C2168|nr:hypothetical protein [Methanocella conradii]